MFAAAIFDMDGTLINSERVIMQAWLSAAKDCGVLLTEAHYIPLVGLRDGQWEPILASHVGDYVLFSRIKEQVAANLRDAAASGICTLKAGVLELLMALRELGVPCAVASSSHVREIQCRLGQANVLHFFDSITGGNEVPHGKPDPAIYHLAAARLGLKPDHCVAFEDSEYGVESAFAAGMRAVMIPDLKAPSEKAQGASFCVLDTLTQAVELVPAWFGEKRA
jgi:HAD superfamily hydrolase (TIGR01509 family)